MSVIASNSVNFVPIYQLLKNYPDSKTKDVAEEQVQRVSDNFEDTAEISKNSSLNLGTNPISLLKVQDEQAASQMVHLEVFENKEQFAKKHDVQSILSQADSLRSFIVDAKDKAVAQQANQSRQTAMFLI